MASTKISYLYKKVYIGIDVHKETYSVTCICDDLIVKKAASITSKVHRPSAPHSINISMCHSLFCKQHMEVLWIWLR
jgi:hypothetical protein